MTTIWNFEECHCKQLATHCVYVSNQIIYCEGCRLCPVTLTDVIVTDMSSNLTFRNGIIHLFFCYTNFVSSGVIPGPLVRLCHFPNPVPSEKVVREVELLEVRQDRVELGKALVVNVGIGQVETADPEQIFIFKIGVLDINQFPT